MAGRPLSIVCALAALLVCAMPARAQAPAFVSAARHAAIMDGETGLLLYCQNCNEPMAPASMSKMMTALIVMEALAAGRVTENTRLTVSERAWRQGAMSDGSHMFLALNSEARVGDLLRGMMIVSANDACIALAEGIAGSEEAFVDLMNRRARELGLTSARFRNTTGLPDPDHVISAADLARLARQIIVRFPAYYRLYGERAFTYNNHTQENRNPLLGLFAGADGVKTGHTAAAGYSLVGAALLNGQRRIIVFDGMETMAARRAEAERLMRAAFYDFRLLRLYEAGAQVGEARVWLGGRARAPLITERPIILPTTGAALVGLRAWIEVRAPVAAPIRRGQRIASLVVEGPNFPRRAYALVSGRTIGRANWFVRAWTGLIDLIAPA